MLEKEKQLAAEELLEGTYQVQEVSKCLDLG